MKKNLSILVLFDAPISFFKHNRICSVKLGWKESIQYDTIFCIHYLFATFLLSVNQALIWQRLMLKKVAFFRILAHINIRTHKHTEGIYTRRNDVHNTYTRWCVTGKGMDDFSLPVNSSNVNFYLVNHGLSKKRFCDEWKIDKTNLMHS